MAKSLAPDLVVTERKMGVHGLLPCRWLSGILFPGLLFVLGLAARGPEDRGPVEEEPWRITIAPASEPGERLVVSGTVYGPDGRTPAAGVTLDLHHTDARGYYSADGKKESEPRLRGRLRTSSKGEYEFQTIKPASYPGGGNPAHIHVKASAGGFPEQWPDEFRFEGDPFIRREAAARAATQGTFSPICRLTRDESGVLRCVRNIRLKSR